MPCLEGMHAPGNAEAHLMIPAGYTDPNPSDVFRFNRVAPHYPPDPCIRPNEADLMCPNQDPLPRRNHPGMPAAGATLDVPSDVYRFNKVYQSRGNPSAGVITQDMTCPCINRPHYPPSKPPRHFDYRYPSGPVECNSGVHKKGHVPAECGEKYEPRDGPICWAKPVPSDCRYCPPAQNIAAEYTNSPQAGYYPALTDNNSSDYYDDSPEDGFSDPNLCPVRRGARAPTPYGRSSCTDMMRQALAGQIPPDPYSILGNKSYRNDYIFKKNGFAGLSPSDPSQPRDKMAVLSLPNPLCPHLYNPSPYVCRPVYDPKCLLDCPEQDGPPADSYTFL